MRDDFISRNDAIDVLENKEIIEDVLNPMSIFESAERRKAIQLIQELPSVQPKADVLEQIKSIVDKWKADSWTDGLSYESMFKIAELMDGEVKQ